MSEFLGFLRPPLMLFFLCTSLLLVIATSLLKKIGIYTDHFIMKYWSIITCKIYKIKILREGSIKDIPSIIVSDHISYWDILTLGATFRAFFVSKASVKSWPLIGWGAIFMRTVFIIREKKRSALETLKKDAKKLINQKESIIMFAEGTTSDSPCKPFKHGAFYMSKTTDTPIKPIALYYDRIDIMRWIGEESFVHHILRMTFTPEIKCYIYEFPVIYPANFKTIDEMSSYCQNIIQQKIDEYKNRSKKEE